MRATLLCLLILAITASCTQEAASQAAAPFDREGATVRVREADFHYSMGLLLTEEQTHSVAMIRERLDAALETRFASQQDSAVSFVMGEGPFHFASIGGVLVRINSFDTPYFPEDEEFTDETLREAAGRHTAWVAVDVERREGGPTEAGAYRLAGRILEKLADNKTLVIFSATDQTIATWEEDFRDLLRGPNPRSIFGDLAGELAAPVEDPEMEAAVDEAQRRFPEFQQAFARRGDADSLFLVSAPFDHSAGVEVMWVEVTAVGDDSVTGTLANEPYYVENIQKGDVVTVQREDITDWVFQRGRDRVGGFAMALLARRAQAAAAANTAEDGTAEP